MEASKDRRMKEQKGYDSSCSIITDQYVDKQTEGGGGSMRWKTIIQIIFRLLRCLFPS